MNLILPFMIDEGLFRGRAVKLDSLTEQMRALKEYPPLVEQMLAEAMALTAMLSDSIKYEGTFTLQIQSEGAINLLLVDLTHDGKMRAFAHYNPDTLPTGAFSLKEIFGTGSLAFMVKSDKKGQEDYQGVVELEGESLAKCAEKYFAQSEQLLTKIELYGETNFETGHISAAGIMLQKMPEKKNQTLEETTIDKWETASTLLASVKKEELLDKRLSPEKLLFRLFHQNDLTLFPAKDLTFACKCSLDKGQTMLKSLSKEELKSLCKNGVLEISCQFCGKKYFIKEEEIL